MFRMQKGMEFWKYVFWDTRKYVNEILESQLFKKYMT